MKFSYKIIFIIFFSFTFTEKLIYSAGFRLFDAGEAIFTSEIAELDGTEVIHLTSTVNTNSFLSRFYKVRDLVKIWSNKNDLTLMKIVKKTRQGKYKLDYSAIVTDELQLISNKKIIQLESKVYDPISAIFMIRQKELIIGSSFKFTTVENDIIQKINVMVGNIENISVPYGTFNTFQLIPISDDNKPLFRNDGKMKVWYSTDSLHLPIKIEQKTNVGTLILKLKEYFP